MILSGHRVLVTFHEPTDGITILHIPSTWDVDAEHLMDQLLTLNLGAVYKLRNAIFGSFSFVQQNFYKFYKRGRLLSVGII